MDFYVFSDGKEMAQIAYDASHAVKAVSVDYLGGVGAPDYKLVVGPNVDLKPDGSIYKARALRQSGRVGLLQPHWRRSANGHDYDSEELGKQLV